MVEIGNTWLYQIMQVNLSNNVQNMEEVKTTQKSQQSIIENTLQRIFTVEASKEAPQVVVLPHHCFHPLSLFCESDSKILHATHHQIRQFVG